MTTPPMSADTRGVVIRPYEVSVRGYSGYSPIYAATRGKALAKAWRCDAFNNLSFGEFLKVARAKAREPGERFGEPITVCGKPAFLISWDTQYIQFVRTYSDQILNSHPLDVEPPEARRGTPYYVATPTSNIKDNPKNG